MILWLIIFLILFQNSCWLIICWLPNQLINSLFQTCHRWLRKLENNNKLTNTNFLSKRSLMRSHPVSGNSGLPRLLGMALGERMGAGAGLVEEVEEEEEGICACWAAATSAAWTLGSRKQKEGGLALWMKPCSRPVLRVPRGAESACCLCGAKLVLGCSGCIVLQLASDCSRETETHGHGLGCCTHCLDLSCILKTNSLKANEILAGIHRLSSWTAAEWCSPITTN